MSAYKRHGCRCERCKQAWADYNRNRRSIAQREAAQREYEEQMAYLAQLKERRRILPDMPEPDVPDENADYIAEYLAQEAEERKRFNF